MKKEKKYSMEKLTCGILRMKGEETIKKPLAIQDKKTPSEKRTTDHVSYGEMIPGITNKKLSPNKTPSAHKAMKSVKAEGSDCDGTPPWEQPSFKDAKSFYMTMNFHEKEKQLPLEIEDSICTICGNKRPDIMLKKEFSYSDLYEATDGFSSKNFLSEGGFGTVYKGELKCGLKVAVKQHKDVSYQGEKEFKSEVDVLSRARHQNLVMLLGSCSEQTHRLLVYEFVCYGSLDQHLSGNAEKPLTWGQRIKVAFGAAKGLDYLHRINITHRDMRPNNILITHDYQSLLGDFGLARIQSGDSDETSVVGTLGYVAPEYAETGKVSTKTDVYSFGVVLLQLITGCNTNEDKFQGKTLLQWARPLVEEKNYPYLIDESIVDSHDVHQLLLMVRLAEDCLHKDPNKRVTMTHVVNELEYIMEGHTKHNDGQLPSLASRCLVLHGSPSEEEEAIASSIYTEKKHKGS